MNDITALSPVTPEMLASLKLSAMNLAEGEMMSFEPAVFRALVEALEKAQKSNQFLKDQLSELANFNPDWDKLEASYESWREIAAELLVAKDRIAELESRIVTVKLPTTRFWAGMIECYEKADVITAIREAGGEISND